MKTLIRDRIDGMTKHRWGLSVVLALAACTSIHGVVLVREHQPVAKIVVAGDASEQVRAAAQTLQAYIAKSTGATLPIALSAADGAAIHVGVTAYVRAEKLLPAGLDEDGFVLQGGGEGNYVIVGGSDWGTEFGVYEFLERYVGVRWLMPTELGEDVPRHATLEVPGARVREEPVYLSRQLSPMDIPNHGVYLNVAGTRAIDGYYLGPDAPNRFNVAWARFNRARGRVAFHHNMENIVPPHLFTATHPEFFPIYDGRRMLPTAVKPAKTDGPLPVLTEERRSEYLNQGLRWQPNYSAPGLIDAAVGVIDRYFQEHPGVKTFSLGMNDSSRFDESPESRARRSGRKNYVGFEDVSDEYFAWATPVVEKLVAKYPDAWFGTLAYHNIAEPPDQVEVHRRLVPFLTYERMRWEDPELRAFGEELTRRWAAVSPVLGWYDYTYGVPYMVPRLWPERMKDYLIWGTQHQVKFYYAELYPCWGEGPKAWVQTKLLWNPHQDVRALEVEWYTRAAGPAAAVKLQEYFAIWEKFWTEDLYRTEWNRRAGQREFLPFTDRRYLLEIPDAYVAQANTLMHEARRLADTPERRARVEKLYEFWEYYRLSIIACQGEVRGQEAIVATEADALQLLADAPRFLEAIGGRLQLLHRLHDDPMWVLMSHLFKIRWTPMRGDDWGQPLLTKLQPWVGRSAKVKNRVEELSRHPDAYVQAAFAKILKPTTQPARQPK